MNTNIKALAIFLAVVGAGPASAAVTNWTVQSASSNLTLSGSLLSGGTFLAAVESQTPGNSLTASYAGTVTTTDNRFWNDDPLLSIQFAGGNFYALNSGSWDPIPGGSTGTAPANYGAFMDMQFLGGVNLAVRNLAAQLNSDLIALTGTAPGTQTFHSDITLEYLSGVADYRIYGIIGGALGDYDPVLYAGETETFQSNGSIQWGVGGLSGVATLTIPASVSFYALLGGSDTTSTADDIAVVGALTGQIVATAVVPEANALVLLGLAGSVTGFLSYRRARR